MRTVIEPFTIRYLERRLKKIKTSTPTSAKIKRIIAASR